MSCLSRTPAAIAVVLSSLVAASSAFASSTAVDTTFGNAGETVVTLNGGWAPGADAVRTPDDGFAVAGVETGYGIAIARFTPSGTLNSAFSGDGIDTLPVPGASSYVDVAGVASDGSGNLYVAAFRSDYTSAVYKFAASGGLASGFGSGGIVELGMARFPGGIRLSPDGARVYAATAEGHNLQVHALSASTGEPDLVFGGGDGLAEVATLGNASTTDLVVRPTDGKIFVGGTIIAAPGAPTSSSAVARFTSAGQPDSGFGTGGVAQPFLGSSAQESSTYDLFALADGTTYVVGSGDSNGSMAIARLTDTGARDSGFGNGGLLTDYAPGSYSRWDGVNVQADGHVVVTGGRHATPALPSAITRRYTATGQLDTSFADGGSLVRSNTWQAFALVAQTSGGGRYVSTAMEEKPGAGNVLQLVVTGIKPNLPSTGGGGTSGTGGTGGTGGGGTSTPTPTPPAPVAEGCTRSVVVGPLEVVGSCLKREGMIWTTSAAASVGGLTFVPNGSSAKLIIDPLNLRIATSGSAKIVFEASLYGRSVGPVKLYEGAFDWTFQYRPDLSGLARLVMPQPGTGGKSVSQSTLKGLPGLSGVGSLPKLSVGMPDFSKVTAPDVAKLAGKIPSLRTPDVEIPLSLLNVPELPELRFQVPSAAGAMFGFPVQGDIAIKAGVRNGARGVDVTANLALPAAFGGITGSSKLFVSVKGQVIVDAVGVSAQEITLPGAITVKPVKLAYDGPSDTWSGETMVYLGFKTGDTGLGGRWVIQGGKLKRIAVTVGGIPLGGVATIDSLSADLTLEPTRLFGKVSVGFGPNVPALNVRAVTVDGTFDFNGDFAKIGGALRVANIPLANASAEYWWNGYFAAKGRVSHFVDAKKEYGFEGTIEGEATKSGFNAEGSVVFKAKGNQLSGQAIVSSVGIAGCASVKGFLWRDINVGAGYKWNAKYIDWLGGNCDFGPYRAKLKKAELAQRLQAGPITQVVGKDERAVSFKVLGTGPAGAPQFTLTGPSGETVTTPADGSTLIDDQFMVVQQPEEGATYVAVPRPKAGNWTFTPAAGSTFTEIQGAEALPKPDVKASVKGGKVGYEIKTIPGQSVRFIERGTNVSVELGTAKNGKGSFKLQPEAGKGGKREILAVVEQDGMPRERLVVARYSAKVKTLAAPKVSVKRTKSGVAKVSWKKVPGAEGYRVIVKLNGRTEQRTVEAKTTKVEVPGVLAESGIEATVQAVGGPTRVGKTGKASIKKPKTKARKKASGKK